MAYQASNDSSHIENSPEPGEVATLVLLERIGDHDCALSSPEESSTETKPSTSEDVETLDILVDGDQERDSIETITETTEGESILNTKAVDNGSTNETKHSEGGVERSVLEKILARVVDTQIDGMRYIPCRRRVWHLHVHHRPFHLKH